jgi:tRNA modification GTPase
METIFAPISNVRNSAVCIIRISGSNIFAVSKFIPSLVKIKHRFAMRVKIFDIDGTQLDDALALYFVAPNSFTGEDVLEISLHASPFIVSKFLSIIATLPNFRFAKAGEFCFRAVENNKISLNEAEAINKLILSDSQIKHNLAINELNGVCKDYYNHIKSILLKILSLLETFIDFSEDEEISVDFIYKIKEINADLILSIQKTIQFSQKKENFDVQIAILGKPNVGKSSLFNLLTSTDDAIVSEIAGTTRDAIKKTLNIAGFKVELIDTAGIRDNTEQIEKIGIEKAKNLAMNADIILLLQEKEDEFVVDLSCFNGVVLVVFTKKDIHGVRGADKENVVNISVLQNNIAELEEKIYSILESRFHEMQSIGFLCNERQKTILQTTLSILQNIDYTQSAELLSEEFRHALHSISFLIGYISTEDILGEIFSNFCIGK